MIKYEFLDHTADAKFKAYGKNLEEAYKNAALALTALVTDVKKIKPVQVERVEVQAKKKETLLYEFMEELIVLMDTKGFVLGTVPELIISISNSTFTLKATLKGDNADNYEIFSQIKAPTYSDMFIKEEQGKTTIQFVPDI